MTTFASNSTDPNGSMLFLTSVLHHKKKKNLSLSLNQVNAWQDQLHCCRVALLEGQLDDIEKYYDYG